MHGQAEAAGFCAANDLDPCRAEELIGSPPTQPLPPAPAGLSLMCTSSTTITLKGLIAGPSMLGLPAFER